MKVITGITVYDCEHCNKRYYLKHFCEKHEKSCSKNPDNLRLCFAQCKHLQRREIEYECGTDYSGDPFYSKGSAFFCGLKGDFLLPPKITHKANGEGLRWIRYDGEELKQINMPRECFEYEHGFGRVQSNDLPGTKLPSDFFDDF